MADDVSHLMEAVVRHLLGEPNRSLSSRHELRFGAKGSTSVDLRKGTWFDWEANAGGGVVDLVVRERGLPDRRAAAEWLRAERYLDVAARPPPRPAARSDDPRRAASAGARLRFALAIWRASSPAPGTPVETYLRSRRIALTPIPRRLQFARELPHAASDTAWPAMVALVTRGSDDRPLAVHRTWLARDGRGKAPVVPNKMGLGRWSGGAVKLAPPSEHLLVGEGIETCLAAMQATGVGAWAALSTSGLMNLELPPEVRRVTVLADNDPVNPKTGVKPGEAAARAAASRWRNQGRAVAVATPPDEGTDFADMLMQQEESEHADDRRVPGEEA